MRVRSCFVAASGLLVVAAALLLCSSKIEARVSERVELSADVLSRSRGNNPTSVLFQLACDLLNNNPCIAVNTPCNSCSQLTDTVIRTGTNGGYYNGRLYVGGCSSNLSGTCDAFLNCVTVPPPTGTCAGFSTPTIEPQ